MLIVDRDVVAVIAQPKDAGWCMRLQASSMLEEDPDAPEYIWYRMMQGAWAVLPMHLQQEYEEQFQAAKDYQ